MPAHRGDGPLVLRADLELPNGAEVAVRVELPPSTVYADALELTEVVQRAAVQLASAAGAARPDPPF